MKTVENRKDDFVWQPAVIDKSGSRLQSQHGFAAVQEASMLQIASAAKARHAASENGRQQTLVSVVNDAWRVVE